MLEKVDEFGPIPIRLGGELSGEQAADRDPEIEIAQVHEYEGEQEVGNRHADEADERGQVIARRVLAHCRIHADGKGHRPGEEDRAQADGEGEDDPVADHIVDPVLRFHGEPHIPLQQAFVRLVEGHEPAQTDPIQVAHGDRLVEVEHPSQVLDLAHVELLALGLQLGHERGEEIARRQLDDGEGAHRNHQERGHHDEEPAADERMLEGDQ